MTRRVLLYGDSNTHGTPPLPALFAPPQRLGAGVRWPGVAARALGDGWELIEEGLPGRTTVLDDPVEGAHLNGLAVLPAVLGSHVPLDAVAIMLGTNDLKARFSLHAVDVAIGTERLARCVADRCPGVPVLLIAPPPPRAVGPFVDMFRGAETRGAGLGAQIAAAAARRGVAAMDAGEVIGVDPVDGVHFDAEAHGRLGAAVAEKLRGMLG